MKKNDLAPLTIESITSEGSGVGHYEGMAIFVPMTVPGDRITVRIVKVQKSYCFGIVEQLLEPSVHRVEPDCPVFSRCGGCTLRQMDYPCELAEKQRWVSDAVQRIGGLTPELAPILPSPAVDGYRNKAQYPFGRTADGKTVCGFFAPRTHSIVASRNCRLQPQIFSTLCDVVCSYIDDVGATIYDEATGQGLMRHLYLRQAEATGQLMVALVINGSQIPHAQRLVTLLTVASDKVTSIQLNHNVQRTNVILGSKFTSLWGSSVINDQLCGVSVALSPLSFYQVNRRGAQQLYAVAAQLAQLQDGQLLLDLYCGAGTIGLSMVKEKPLVQLIGVEIIAAAVENAKQNAQTAGIPNARFIAADAGAAAKQLANEGLRPDVIVVDPPRKGCDGDAINAILQLSPERIVMVSCNPATMARDLRLLCDGGYCAVSVHPVDMFPRTSHVESVALLSRKK
ncbi:MAG: 23S rRNA (uracil(1939)-C(5))-methyltransferase RlmD [Angelakisella sp.]